MFVWGKGGGGRNETWPTSRSRTRWGGGFRTFWFFSSPSGHPSHIYPQPRTFFFFSKLGTKSKIKRSVHTSPPFPILPFPILSPAARESDSSVSVRFFYSLAEREGGKRRFSRRDGDGGKGMYI